MLNFLFLFCALVIIYVFIIQRDLKKARYGLPVKENKEYRINDSIKIFTEKNYFDTPFSFSFIEYEKEDFVLFINRNYSVFFLYSLTCEEKYRFMSFFRDGTMILSGNADFELKSIEGSGLVARYIIEDDIDGILRFHLDKIREKIETGKLIEHGTVRDFFSDLGFVVDVNDASRIKELQKNKSISEEENQRSSE